MKVGKNMNVSCSMTAKPCTTRYKLPFVNKNESMPHFPRFHPAVTANSPQWNPDQAATKKPSWYEFHQDPKPPRKKVSIPSEKTHPRMKEIVEAVSGVLGSAPSGRSALALGTVLSG